MLVFDEKRTGVPGEKPLLAESRTNKLNPHTTPSAEIDPGPHWWKGRQVLSPLGQRRHLNDKIPK